MDKELEPMLKYLRLEGLLTHWGEHLAAARDGKFSHERWLSELIARDYTIHCGYDTDEAGDRAAAAMITAYPSVKRLQPPAHDWNDALVAQLSNTQ